MIGDNEGPERERLLAIARELEDVLSSEPRPLGIDAEALAGGEEPPDLHTLLSAMTALTREVRTQGRAFSELRSALEGEKDPPSAPPSHGDDGTELAMEMAERLERLCIMLESRPAEDPAPRRHWLLPPWRRREKAPAQPDPRHAAAEGLRLLRSRVDDFLSARDFQRMDAIGRPFDPRFMEAVEAAEAPGVEDGVVLDVYREGYLHAGALHRTAKVKVCRNHPQSTERPPDPHG